MIFHSGMIIFNFNLKNDNRKKNITSGKPPKIFNINFDDC